MNEFVFLQAALAAYVIAGSSAIFAVIWRRRVERAVLAFMLIGLLLHTVAIALRWERLGNGPFLTMYEVLSSNVWSLMLAFAIAYWRIPSIRDSAAVVMPILFMMMGWLGISNPGQAHMPPTYNTIWLWFHVAFGKVFLGATMVAVGLSGVILARHQSFWRSRFERLPADDQLGELAYRCMALAFVFESLMLVAGAIWAQDAWGRYWAWDPLESWAFLTWLALAIALHLRVTYRLSPSAGALLVLTVFALAFLTFFGVPFISDAPHKGAV